jgi:hypothetical protein
MTGAGSFAENALLLPCALAAAPVAWITLTASRVPSSLWS